MEVGGRQRHKATRGGCRSLSLEQAGGSCRKPERQEAGAGTRQETGAGTRKIDAGKGRRQEQAETGDSGRLQRGGRSRQRQEAAERAEARDRGRQRQELGAGNLK